MSELEERFDRSKEHSIWRAEVKKKLKENKEQSLGDLRDNTMEYVWDRRLKRNNWTNEEKNGRNFLNCSTKHQFTNSKSLESPKER